tara:strand:- start:3654 stop:3863 length:210 start_codon:yes stop_codon:yes gene_type:complete
MDYQEIYNLQEENKNLIKNLNRYKNLVQMIVDELDEHLECIRPIVNDSFTSELSDLREELISFNIKYGV